MAGRALLTSDKDAAWRADAFFSFFRHRSRIASIPIPPAMDAHPTYSRVLMWPWKAWQPFPKKALKRRKREHRRAEDSRPAGKASALGKAADLLGCGSAPVEKRRSTQPILRQQRLANRMRSHRNGPAKPHRGVLSSISIASALERKWPEAIAPGHEKQRGDRRGGRHRLEPCRRRSSRLTLLAIRGLGDAAVFPLRPPRLLPPSRREREPAGVPSALLPS